MCDPLTIAGMALTAGSTVANSMAANKAAKARSSVMAAERVRQGMLDKEADALNLTSRERYTDFPEKQEERAGQLADLYNAPEATPAGELLPATTSNVTVQETEKQKAKAKEYTTKQGKALGTLRSFGDYLGDVSRSQAREAGLVGQIGGFKQGSAASCRSNSNPPTRPATNTSFSAICSTRAASWRWASACRAATARSAVALRPRWAWVAAPIRGRGTAQGDDSAAFQEPAAEEPRRHRLSVWVKGLY